MTTSGGGGAFTFELGIRHNYLILTEFKGAPPVFDAISCQTDQLFGWVFFLVFLSG